MDLMMSGENVGKSLFSENQQLKFEVECLRETLRYYANAQIYALEYDNQYKALVAKHDYGSKARAALGDKFGYDYKSKKGV